jgi:hypothetical protein
MLNHKVGDTVRIQSQDWIDDQEKDRHGDISPVGRIYFVYGMYKFAGRTPKIVIANEDSKSYKLDIDGREYNWQDWMFDPDYNPDGPLSAEDAVLAMLDWETLYNKDGNKCYWDNDNKCFCLKYPNLVPPDLAKSFDNLSRRSAKHKRPWTRWEILAWANSDESRGWFVRMNSGDWKGPASFDYTCTDLEDFVYQRAKLLPDLSGIDESTIQGFEVEV